MRRVRRSEQITALRILKWRGDASGINTSRGNLGISTRSDTNAMFKVRDAQAETCFNQHVCVDNKRRPTYRFKNTCTAAMGVLLSMDRLSASSRFAVILLLSQHVNVLLCDRVERGPTLSRVANGHNSGQKDPGNSIRIIYCD